MRTKYRSNRDHKTEMKDRAERQRTRVADWAAEIPDWLGALTPMWYKYRETLKMQKLKLRYKDQEK